MGKKKYTPEEDALILSLKERGVKYQAIAKQIGRTESAVWQRIAALKANKKPASCGTLGEEGSTCAKTIITADGKSEGLRVVGKVNPIVDNNGHTLVRQKTLDDFPPREIIKHLYNLGYRIINGKLACVKVSVVNINDIINEK